MNRLGTILSRVLLTGAACLLLNVPMDTYAAKGDSKEEKSKKLDVSGFKATVQNLKIHSTMSSRSGWTYKGSSPSVNSPMRNSSIVTFKKGNTIYLYPVKLQNKFPKFKTPEAPRF